MQVDVSFVFAKVYDINRFDVAQGQKFTLLTDYDQESRWLSDNDPVLALTVNGNNADVEATGKGESQIWISDANGLVIKKIYIKVVDAIVEPPKNLNLSADVPVTK